MTSPDERARGIAEKIAKATYICDCAAWCEHVKTFEDLIAAHLRAYGEEEFKRGIRTANSPVIVSGPSKIEELMKPYGDKREADGFRRGVEEAAKICDERSKDEFKDMFRKAEDRKCAFKIRELQRGQEGEK